MGCFKRKLFAYIAVGPHLQYTPPEGLAFSTHFLTLASVLNFPYWEIQEKQPCTIKTSNLQKPSFYIMDWRWWSHFSRIRLCLWGFIFSRDLLNCLNLFLNKFTNMTRNFTCCRFYLYYGMSVCKVHWFPSLYICGESQFVFDVDMCDTKWNATDTHVKIMLLKMTELFSQSSKFFLRIVVLFLSIDVKAI